MSTNPPNSSSGSVLQLASKAEESLVLVARLLKSRAAGKPHGGQSETHWDLFLERGQTPPDTIETCAISVGGDALLRAGEPPDSELVLGAARLVKRLQRPDGGWNSFSRSTDEESLTLEAYFAVGFLDRVEGDDFSKTVDAALKWLFTVEAPAPGGWGFYATDTSKVLPTAYAVSAICAAAQPQPRDIGIRDAIDRGVAWLLQQQNENGSWAQTKGSEGSAVQTAVAIQAILRSELLRPHSTQIIRARHWLLDHLDSQIGIADLYRVPERGKDGKIAGPGRRINHITPPNPVILQALLLAGTDVLDPRLLKLVDAVLKEQREDGSWPCPHVVNERPIFAIWEAAGALQRFIEVVKRDEHILGIKEQVQRLNEKLSLAESRITTMESDALAAQQLSSQIKTQLIEAQKALELAQQNMVRLERWRQGLFVFYPLVWLSNIIRRYPIAVVFVLACAAYASYWLFRPKPTVWEPPDLGFGIFTAVLLGIELVVYYRKRGKG